MRDTGIDPNQLQRGDVLTGHDRNTYRVISISPPHGRRRDALVTVLRLSDSWAWQLDRDDLARGAFVVEQQGDE